MIRRFGLVLALCAALTATVTTEGCTRKPPPTLTTPQGQVAYQIEDLVAAIGSIQHAAITANHNGQVSRATALKVTRSTRAIAVTLNSAIDAGTGTAAVYRDAAVGLAELARDPDLVKFRQEIAAAQVIVAALGGGR